MIFLRFDSEANAREAMSQFMTERGNWPPYIGRAAVDVVGVIYRPTGVLLEGSHFPAPEMKAIGGFHVNLSEQIAELAEYEIPEPTNPDRIFAGYK